MCAIAKKLGTSYPTIRSRLLRMRVKLRSQEEGYKTSISDNVHNKYYNQIQELILAEMSFTEIKEHLNISRSQLSYYFTKWKLKAKRKVCIQENTKFFTDSEISNIKSLYVEGKMVKDIAVLFGCSEPTATKAIKKSGTKIRKSKESLALSTRKYHGPPAKVKNGYRVDLKHYVRSSWEAFFARVLNHCKITYAYEPHTFKLKNGETYTPDFWIPNKNKYYEIKGRVRNDKHIRFHNENPNIQLVLIDQKKFLKILKWFRLKITSPIYDDKDFFSSEYLLNKFNEWRVLNNSLSVAKFLENERIPRHRIEMLFGSRRRFIENAITQQE